MSRQLRTLVRKELTELRADRKAIFISIFLPVLLYPGMFWITSSVEGKEEEALRDADHPVAMTGESDRIYSLLLLLYFLLALPLVYLVRFLERRARIGHASADAAERP